MCARLTAMSVLITRYYNIMLLLCIFETIFGFTFLWNLWGKSDRWDKKPLPVFMRDLKDSMIEEKSIFLELFFKKKSFSSKEYLLKKIYVFFFIKYYRYNVISRIKLHFFFQLVGCI